jgi:hypothetical protein
VKIFDPYKSVAMEVSSIALRDNDIEIKGKGLGSLPMTMYVRPEELWQAFKLAPWALIFRMPLLLLKGWMLSRK